MWMTGRRKVGNEHLTEKLGSETEKSRHGLLKKKTLKLGSVYHVKEDAKHIERNIMFIIVYYSVIYVSLIYSSPILNYGENTTISPIIKLRRSDNILSIMSS